jgi:hypothetical protein
VADWAKEQVCQRLPPLTKSGASGCYDPDHFDDADATLAALFGIT